MASLEEMREYSAFELARMVEVSAPDSSESPGGEFLSAILSDYFERRESLAEERHPEDRFHEMADGIVPVYTHRMWLTFVDLCAYQYDPDGDGGSIAGEMTERAMAILYRIASDLYALLWQEDEINPESDSHVSPDEADDDDSEDESEDDSEDN